MAAPTVIPEPLTLGPFTRQQAIAAGLSDRVLKGRRFRRLYRGVYVDTSHDMTDDDLRRAARLAMPDDAHLSHVSRIQSLGLGLGPATPVHFTVGRELHLAVPGIFLHRTAELPPHDDDGVSAAAAVIGLATSSPLIDVLVAGDWLLSRNHMTMSELVALLDHQPWRPGAQAVQTILAEFDGRSASPPETKARACLTFAGLPRPEVNARPFDDSRCPVNDLLYREWLLALEYEGRQHFSDPTQIRRDIGRYAWMRERGVEYVQVYDRKLSQPRSFVTEVYQHLRRRGYRGPAPHFGRRWRSLFERHRSSPWS